MKSKSLQLQSNKSKKRSCKNIENKKKKYTALLCTISIPWKCVWRCSSGSRMKGSKTEMYHWTLGKKLQSMIFFFSFFEQYQSEYHCYSKCLALFCLEALDLQRQLSLTPAGQSVSHPASQPVSQSQWGGEGECPLSASLLWSSGCQAAAPQRSTSSWAPLDPPSVSQRKKAAPPRLANRGSPPHTASPTGGGPATTRPCCRPALSPISQFFDTKITLAGRCNSHISGIFASVLFIFLKRSFEFIFFNVLYCYFCLHAVVYKILAAELALHCSYAETLWSEVPLYVHPVYWMQNEDQYYRALLIVYLFLNWSCFCVWQYSVVLPGRILRCVKKKK